MADPVVTEVKAETTSLFAKVVAYAKTHATPTVIGTTAGFVAGKFGLIGFLAKLL